MSNRVQWRARAVAGALAIVLTACRPPAPPAPVDPHPLDPGVVAGLARLLQLEDTADPDSAAILAGLSDTSVIVRRAAALAVGQLGVRSIHRSLIDLLDDPDTVVAANAAFSLGLLRDTQAIAKLGNALGGSLPVASAAAWSLGEIGGAAYEPLYTALQGGQSQAMPAIILAAAKLDPLPVVTLLRWAEQTTRASCEPSRDVVWAAAYSLSAGGGPAAVRPLLGLIDSPCPGVRSRAALGLTRSLAGDSLAYVALDSLVVLVKDDNAIVRISALQAIGTYGKDGAPFLMAALSDTDRTVRFAAVSALGPRTDQPSWEKAWAADTSLSIRAVVLDGAARAGVELPALDQWLHDKDWRRRAVAATAAGEDPDLGDSLALPLVHDADPRVRAAAVTAIATLADSQHTGIAWNGLDKALMDKDPYVRAAALGALPYHLPPKEAVPLAIRVYRASLAEPEPDARLAALTLISTAWREDSVSLADSIRRAIASLPVPANLIERAAGASLPVSSGWHDLIALPRPLDVYSAIVRDVVSPSMHGAPPRIALETDHGIITVELDGASAPLTVANILSLIRSGFYDGDIRFHRVVPGFVKQTGDPRGDGNGGPASMIRDEINRRLYTRGTVGMALSGPNTGGSQFFITVAPQPRLDGKYTAFGQVVSGWDAFDAVVQGDRVHIRIAK